MWPRLHSAALRGMGICFPRATRSGCPRLLVCPLRSVVRGGGAAGYVVGHWGWLCLVGHRLLLWRWRPADNMQSRLFVLLNRARATALFLPFQPRLGFYVASLVGQLRRDELHAD